MLKRDNRNGSSPSNVDELVEYTKREFGDVAVHEVHKGENVGWFIDQRLVSILIYDWVKEHGSSRVKLVSRNTNTDRSVPWTNTDTLWAIKYLYLQFMQKNC